MFSLDWSPTVKPSASGKKAPVQAVVVDAAKLESEIKRQKQQEDKKQQAKVAEQERKAEAQKKAEAKKKAEAERKAVEQEMQARLAAEQERMASQRRTAMQRMIDEYVLYIREKVERRWIPPPDSGSGLSCTVEVRLIPSGDVIDAQIVRSSGNPVFDRSVEAAVFKASPLPVPSDLEVMENFRTIRFEFKPG